MNRSDIIAIVVALAAFAAGYALVSWLISIARKGLDTPDYRDSLPPREKFGDRSDIPRERDETGGPPRPN